MHPTLKKLFFLIFYIGSLPLWATTTVPPVIVKKPLSHHGPTIVISNAEMTATGATSLSSALQSLGGVQLQDTTGNGSQVLLSMRGFGANASSNTLLLINGIPLTNPDIAPPDLNAIPIEEVAYIEVFAGSESVLYGDQAVGGVINIVTRKPKNKNFTASCGVGSFNQQDCYASISYPFKEMQFGLGLSTLHTDNYREHNDYDQTLLSGGTAYPYATGNLEFNFKIAKEKMLYPGALSESEMDEDRRQANNDIDFFEDWNGFYHLRHVQEINANWRIETDYTHRNMDGNGVLFASFTQSRNTDYLKPTFQGMIGEAKVTTGLDLEYDRYLLHTDFGDTRDALQKYGLFVFVKNPLTKRFTLSWGARLASQYSRLETSENIEPINRAFATTIDGTFEYTENISFYLRRAGSFRFPKADEMASTLPGTVLKTQRGTAYEGGVTTLWQTLTSQFSVYQLNLVDEITFDPTQTEQDPFGTNRNLPPTERFGFSLSEKYNITDKISLGTQYNYVNARFQSGVNAGKRIPLVSENILHLGVGYEFLDDWNIYTESIYTGSQFPANDDANVSQKIGGYTIFNVHLRYQYENFSASFRLNNLTNKFYNYYTVFTPSTFSESFYPAPGRNFLLTLKYIVE